MKKKSFFKNRILPLIMSVMLAMPMMASPIVTASAAPDGKWGNAQWIWHNSTPAARNTWDSFRRDFMLESVPETAMLNIACDTKYWMWVNGEMVVFDGELTRGPSGPTSANQDTTYYDVVEIAKYLKPGKNSICIDVWYWGNTGGPNNSTRGGLLVSSTLLDAATDKTVATGDGEWWAIPTPTMTTASQSNGSLLAVPNYAYDARNEIVGWREADYTPSAENGWVRPANISAAGEAPWNGLVKRPIPQWMDYGLTIVSNDQLVNLGSSRDSTRHRAIASGYTRYRMQLPYNMQFVPYIKLSADAPAGARIQITTDTYNSGTAMREYITRQGAQSYEERSWFNGDRCYFDLPADITLDMVEEIGYRETGYPITPGTHGKSAFPGYFDSVIDTTKDWSTTNSSYLFNGGHTWTQDEANADNNYYDELWKKAVRTLYLTVRDGFMDCPDRERGQYVGDAVNEFEEAYYSLGNEFLPAVKKCFYEIFDWQFETVVNGRTYYVTSNVRPGKLAQELSSQTLTCIYALSDYYLYTGDADAVEHLWQKMYNYLQNWDLLTTGDYAGTLAMRAAGTNGGYSTLSDWCDWGSNIDKVLIYNNLYYMAANTLYNLANNSAIRVTMTAEQKAFLETRINSIKDNFQKFWDSDVNAYRNRAYNSTPAGTSTTNVDDRGNALAVVNGLCPPELYPQMRELFMGGGSVHEAPHENASIYLEKYVQQALCMMGLSQDAMNRTVKRHSAIVNARLNSTLPENWTFEDGASYGNTNTKNHGWSGGSMIAMSRYQTGVEPTAPGYSKWHVVPQMGSFLRIDTRVPAVIGDIDVLLEKNIAEQTLKMTVTSPGKDAEFWVPVEGKQEVVVKAGNATFDRIEEKYNGTYWVYKAKAAGTYSFLAFVDYNEYNYITLTNILPAAGVTISIDGAAPIAIPTKPLKLIANQEHTLEVFTNNSNEYAFVSWSGGIESNEPKITFELKEDMELTITFKADFYDITFGRDGIPLNSFAAAQDVTISINGDAPTKLSSTTTKRIKAGAEVTVKVAAANDVDFSFSNWSGGLDSSDNPLTFIADKEMTLTANFKWNGYESISYASAGASVVTSGQANSSTWKSANLIDGNIVPNNPTASSLGWSSTSLGSATPTGRHWFSINLGSQKTFDRFHLYPRMDVFASNGGSCYFATEFTIEYSTSNINATTAAQLDALEWVTVPGGTGANGRFIVNEADVPYLKPYVIQLDEAITARYVRVTCHKVNAMASDTTTTWYWQQISFGIYDTRAQLKVSVTTPTIVESLAANLNISVEADYGKALKAYLKVGSELLYETSLTNGKGLMNIKKAPAAGTYDLVVVGDGVYGTCKINIVKNDPDLLWSPKVQKGDDGKLEILFGSVISSKTGTINVTIGNKKISATIVEGTPKLKVDFAYDDLKAGDTIVISGIKYAELFPGYSFSFKVDYK